MFTKPISTACAVILTLVSTSCQKSPTEQFLDTQEDMITEMESVKDQSSANKAAAKITKLRAESKKLEESMSQEEKKKMWDTEKYGKLLFKKEPVKRQLFQKDYYGSYELRQAMFGM
ncbi:hypothetical protein [Akkermansia sp.]|uniref:hypothetical protein n=1 Tax=Akkermansia sp. TaxID=1872421 RepID=UPI0025B891F7|nr:hypothetical protein [Akkermansia sp.]MCC8148225.1 hypothetical protein [Akkermansia sp.]